MHQSYSQYYADLWRRHWWWRVRHEVVMLELSRLLLPVATEGSNPRILDIGCAGGVAFDDFSRFGEMSGIEPDAQLINSCPQWRNCIEQRFFTPDYQPSAPFDVITMLDVLEHIEDDAGTVAHLFSILKPGGYAILTVPALSWLTSIHDKINMHFRRYHRGPFKNLLINAGFQVRQMRYLFGWSIGMVYLRTWLKPSRIEDYHVTVPPSPVNSLFAGLSRCENAIANTVGLSPPWGSSLLAVVQKTSSDSSSIRKPNYFRNNRTERLSRHQTIENDRHQESV
ncbi:MAG: methyltransferase family protein [Planctomycetaceae bacterium]|nr:methyltransferase family protein [Planctomycetaceae bacterium]